MSLSHLRAHLPLYDPGTCGPAEWMVAVSGGGLGGGVEDGGWPLAGDGVGFVFAWPGWHGDAEGGERLGAERAKLEVGIHGDGEADAGCDGDYRFLFVQLAPHLAATA